MWFDRFTYVNAARTFETDSRLFEGSMTSRITAATVSALRDVPGPFA